LPSVRLIGVTKRFERVTAVNHVDLEIRDGEYLCVLGPTGSGKTTLLRLIAGLVRPDEGEVYIDDRLVNDVPPHERNAVYVPQQYALFPHMRVIDNVAFGPLARGLGRERALEVSREMLGLTRLGWRADSLPEELSGGMQQRVALSRGLASGARLLLLDEPLGALDARLRVELRGKLRALIKGSGLTAVHVTHDQEEALTMADRIVVLREGRIQQHGTPFHVYQRPENIFVASFVGGANFLEGVVAERDVDGSWVQLRGGLRVRALDKSHLPGETVVVAVREEKTRPVLRAERGVNVLPGVVTAIRFLGAFTLYEARLENGDTVQSRVPTYPAGGRFSPGQRVAVQFNPEDCAVYPYPSLGLYRELEAI